MRRRSPLLLATFLLAARPAGAQGDVAPPWRSLLGATAFDLRTGAGEVRLGLAGESLQVTLVFRPADVRRFADSLLRLLPQRPRRTASWTLRVEEPGVSAGVLTLSGGGRGTSTARVRLFASDDVLGALRDTLTVGDTRLLARKLREAAIRTLPRRRE